MESRSSESNYGRSYGGSYGGYSSNNSEHIWGAPSIYGYGSEYSNNANKPQVTTKETESKYNNLDDIDKLIERLEASLNVQVTSDRSNQLIERTKQKIESLKQLVAEARKEEEEERIIRQLEQENSELDAAIDSINKGIHK